MPERGLVSFIRTKQEHLVEPDDIKRMLKQAGFSDEAIMEAFLHIKETHRDEHRDEIARNGFLPPLKKKEKRLEHITAAHDKSVHITKTSSAINIHLSPKPSANGHTEDIRHVEISNQETAGDHRGLFKGRLRRKDFILGFMFFFGIGYVTLAFAGILLSLLAPHLWSVIVQTMVADPEGYLLLLIPVILFPVTIMMLSLITRRLHNLGLPGGLSLFFLALFIPPVSPITPIESGLIYTVLAVLFIVLLTVKGSPQENQFGPFPGSRGSFFRRIFNA